MNENEGQRSVEAMEEFRVKIAHAIAYAVSAGLYMPAVVTDMELTLDELKERYPSDVY